MAHLFIYWLVNIYSDISTCYDLFSISYISYFLQLTTLIKTNITKVYLAE